MITRESYLGTEGSNGKKTKVRKKLKKTHDQESFVCSNVSWQYFGFEWSQDEGSTISWRQDRVPLKYGGKVRYGWVKKY